MSHTPQGVSCGGWADEGVFKIRQGSHSGFVTQNTASAQLAAWVYCQHGYFSSLLEAVLAKCLDEGAFSNAGRASDANANGTTTVRKATLYHLLRQCLVLRAGAFDQGNRLTKYHSIAFQNTKDEVLLCSLCTNLFFKIGIDAMARF